MKSLQDIFTVVANHLVAQGARAAGAGGACYYRQGHLKCAVGVLIPDDRYTAEFEGIGLAGFVPGNLTLRSTLHQLDLIDRRDLELTPNSLMYEASRHLQLLTDLQRAHDTDMPHAFRAAMHVDGYGYAELFRHRLDALATQYNLTNPHPALKPYPGDLYD